MPTLKKKYFISFDQNISSEEFMNILYNYNVFFPKDKIEEVLIYLGIPDINAFSLNFMHLIEIIMFIVRIISIKSRKIKRIWKIHKTMYNNRNSFWFNWIEYYEKTKRYNYINGGINFLYSNNQKIQLVVKHLLTFLPLVEIIWIMYMHS